MHSSSDVRPSITLRNAVATVLALSAVSFQLTHTAAAQEAASEDAVTLSDVSVTDDPLRALSSEPSASSFGFAKPILDTPRTVSFVSEEQISLLGISTADDLTRVVPGTFTNRRWGLQGGIDVRGVAADMYFRGMKRLQMQGHARTSLAGMDSIEVIKGPPSPIYGMGRIGGYTNLNPKAGRAKSGKYLIEPQGFIQGIAGSWDRAELSFGLGGPLNLGSKNGGYYAYGIIEDSKTWVKPVHAKQKILQVASSIDNMVGPFRLETGTQYQNSNTAGAFMNRATQALIDDDIYITGTPLANLDSNGDGQIGFLETHRNSPIVGRYTANNSPLNQRFAWPVDPATGKPVPFNDGFAAVPGIPATMLAYLNSHPEINCSLANYMRTLPAGGPVPISGSLPVGFVLNPCTVGTVKVDPRQAVYEKEQDAQMVLVFADLVYDVDPNFTVKNQVFFDRLESFKNSQLPYGETQSVWAVEDKFTITKRIPDAALPDWLRINTLGSLNYRITSAYQGSGGGDFDYRNDIMGGVSGTGKGAGRLISNATFWNNLENDTYTNGAPMTTIRRSRYNESGVGLMFDVDFFKNTNLIVGGRFDWADGKSYDYDRFVQNCAAPAPTCTSTSAFVGRYDPFQSAEGSDDGASWSVSLSHQLPFGIRPYATIARTSSVLDGANNLLDRATINAPGGFIGEAEIEEFGLKNSWFGGKLLLTAAHYKQSRTDLSSDPNDPTIGAEISSTETTGTEVELKWVPTRDIFISAYWIKQEIDYLVLAGGSSAIEITGKQLGFMDIRDPFTGAVYPAEAFLYGGRWQVTLPTDLQSEYMTKNGSPETQVGVNGSYQITKSFGINLGANWFSEIFATRIANLHIPEVTVINAGASYTKGSWTAQLNVSNVSDENYYRPRNGDSVSGLLSSMPGRGWALTLKHDFR